MHGELTEAHLVAEADLAEKGKEVNQLRSSIQELTDEVQLWKQEVISCLYTLSLLLLVYIHVCVYRLPLAN